MGFIINNVEPIPGASQEVQDSRRSICDSCEFYNSEMDMCEECGCLIARKIFEVSDTCPQGKWP
jgi:hypothetical protein